MILKLSNGQRERAVQELIDCRRKLDKAKSHLKVSLYILQSDNDWQMWVDKDKELIDRLEKHIIHIIEVLEKGEFEVKS